MRSLVREIKSTTYIVKNFIINTYNQILTVFTDIKHQKNSFTNTIPPQKNDLENLVVESIKNEFEDEKKGISIMHHLYNDEIEGINQIYIHDIKEHNT